MTSRTPTLALAIAPRMLRDALARVLAGRGYEIVLLDGVERCCSRHFDVVVSQGRWAQTYDCDVLIDVSDEPMQAREGRAAVPTALPSLADLVAWVEERAGRVGLAS
jgi:hypothetical protein